MIHVPTCMELTRHPLAERIRHALRVLGDQGGTAREIAEVSGLRRTQVSRELSYYRVPGVLRVQNRGNSNVYRLPEDVHGP